MEKRHCRILIVTYDYYPHISPRAFRWTAIAEHWAELGYDVDVVCNRFSMKHKRMETEKNLRIFRVIDPLMFLKTVNFDRKSRQDIRKSKRGNPAKKFLSCFIRASYNCFVKKTYWPDYAFLWIFSVFFKARHLLSAGEYDLVISVSHPFSSHVAVFLCSEGFKNGKWIVDIGDPFSFLNEVPVNNFKIYKTLNFTAERRILLKSDVISVTTDKTKEKYIEHFKDISKKIYTIPPLLSVSLKYGKKSVSANVSMLFVGTLYKEIRNPRFLLETFRQLLERGKTGNIELHFAGNVNNCVDMFKCCDGVLNDKIFLHGQVTREKVLELIDEAQILVNIDNGTSFQLPSKVIEYMATGKPILNITTGKTKFTDHIIAEYPNVLNIDSSTAINEKMLNEMEYFILNRRILEEKEVEQSLFPYRMQAISDKYLSLVNVI